MKVSTDRPRQANLQFQSFQSLGVVIIFNTLKYGIFLKIKIHGLKKGQNWRFGLLKLSNMILHKIWASQIENLGSVNTFRCGIFSKKKKKKKRKKNQNLQNAQNCSFISRYYNCQIWFHIKSECYLSQSENTKLACQGLYVYVRNFENW